MVKHVLQATNDQNGSLCQSIVRYIFGVSFGRQAKLHTSVSRLRLGNWAAASLASAALAGCIPSIKSTFAEASYPKEHVPVAPRAVALSVDAAVVPSLLVAYERPRQVARCLSAAADNEAALTGIFAYGDCLLDRGTPSSCAPRLPWIATSTTPWTLTGCPAGLSSHRDRMRFVLALAEAGAAVRAYEVASAGHSSAGKPAPKPLRAALARTLGHAAMILDRDAVAPRAAMLPAIALSGGAANGAFVAGYLHALFWARERALIHASAAEREAIAGYRFGSVFGSSVGSLIALPLDLYFATSRPLPAEERALDACIRAVKVPASGKPDRKLQDCALAKLETDFVKNEWELLCAQRGSILDLIGPDAESLLRFDPLEKGVIDPFFAALHRPLLANDFTRTAMAVDLRQHVLVGLDERACLIPGTDALRCLREGVLASIVEPVFVPARPSVYSGLQGPPGETGTWLDGSIRSLNPAARAATYTFGRVLAVNTHRAHGVPGPAPKGVLPLLLATFDALGAGSRAWELRYARVYQEARKQLACDLAVRFADGILCEEPAAAPGSPSRDGLDGDLYEVWVPEDIAPSALSAGGYTFDPVVMRGLFLWGQKEFLRSRRRLLGWLGWCAIARLEDSSVACRTGRTSPAFAAELRSLSDAIERELAGLGKYADPATWQRHLDERRELVEDRLETCN
jgi:hypothetical protein